MEDITFKYYKRPLGYMIATRAFHLLGDLSRDEGDLCHIWGDTREDFGTQGYYVGMWETGFGFVNVLFPKQTTRVLTDDEVAKYAGLQVQIGNQMPRGYNADDLRASRDRVTQLKSGDKQ